MESPDSLYYDSIDLLKSMIEIPSFSKEEIKVADMLCEYLESKGQQVHRQGNNIWCLPLSFDPAKPSVLLNSHIDTVKPVSGWTEDPFNPREENGRINGLGSNDAGASLVSLLHAFLFLSNKGQSYNPVFLASCEEEISGKGGVELALSSLPGFSFGVIGEPTGMHPAIAEKGLMVLDCSTTGKAGHAARDEGENAIYKAVDSINWFREYKFERVSPLLGRVKMSVTILHSGTQHNVVPDTCTFVVDIRSNECYSNQEILDIVRKNCGCEANARSTRLNSSFVSPEHPFVKRALLLGKETFGSPTLSDQSLMNFPTVKIGPGNSARSHTANEYIETQEIREAIDTYIKLLDGLNL